MVSINSMLIIIGKPIDLSNGSVYMDVAPANIMKMKDDILLKAKKIEDYENLIDKKNTE